MGSTPIERRILTSNLASVALNYFEVSEIPGVEHNPTIVKWHQRIMPWVKDDETPWCSSFMNYVADVAGRETSGKPNALSWTKVGVELPNFMHADPSDTIVIFDWKKGGAGHVGVYVKHDANHVWVLGGNQANKVKISKYRIHGYDRVMYLRYLRKV